MSRRNALYLFEEIAPLGEMTSSYLTDILAFPPPYRMTDDLTLVALGESDNLIEEQINKLRS